MNKRICVWPYINYACNVHRASAAAFPTVYTRIDMKTFLRVKIEGKISEGWLEIGHPLLLPRNSVTSALPHEKPHIALFSNKTSSNYFAIKLRKYGKEAAELPLLQNKKHNVVDCARRWFLC